MKRIVLLITLLIPIIISAQLGKYDLITTHTVAPAVNITPGDVVQIILKVQHPNWSSCDSWLNGVLLDLGPGYNPSSVNYISAPSPIWISADLATDMPINSIGWGFDIWNSGTPFSSWGQSSSGPYTFILSVTVVSINPNDLDIEAYYYGDYDTGAYSFGSCGNINDPDGPYLFFPEAALPIRLLSFDGKENGKSNLLNWVTNSEINNHYYLLEKSSDGQKFTPIETVDGAGNSNSVLSYESIDYNPSTLTYYKLTQIDFDGKSESFDVISVRNNTKKNTAELLYKFNSSGQLVYDDYKGLCFEYYSDNTVVKSFN